MPTSDWTKCAITPKGVQLENNCTLFYTVNVWQLSKYMIIVLQRPDFFKPLRAH